MRYKNKDKEEHYATILEVCMKRVPLRNIRAGTMTSPIDLNKKLLFLQEVEMLKREIVDIQGDPVMRNGIHVFYTTTPKGKKYLQLYKKAAEMVKGIERIAST